MIDIAKISVSTSTKKPVPPSCKTTDACTDTGKYSYSLYNPLFHYNACTDTGKYSYNLYYPLFHCNADTDAERSNLSRFIFYKVNNPPPPPYFPPNNPTSWLI